MVGDIVSPLWTGVILVAANPRRTSWAAAGFSPARQRFRDLGWAHSRRYPGSVASALRFSPLYAGTFGTTPRCANGRVSDC
jgi:hypothetical protein